MRHKRSLELAPGDRHTPEIEWPTLEKLPEWYALVGRCHACAHEEVLERRTLARRCGSGIALAALPAKLKCRQCGNRQGNRLFLGKLAR